ncbi:MULTISPECIES: hypothetical protein [Planktothrix]|uniref:Uncharacterized protein n=1 Tax=Planktothrix tepida PCC 9214 TaxID=671072 RepID=A0A1J1LNQ9_9CYAN|nr:MULTISPECIES: hypothetical protein [Planktothrix]CUR33634.1 hypothetical protein PL9214520173 [Planktothrix tepida PCC 9214]
MAINLNHSRKDWNSEQVWRIEFGCCLLVHLSSQANGKRRFSVSGSTAA